MPYIRKRKGADKGIDGLIYLKSDSDTSERAVVSVKGGDDVNVAMIRDLKGALEREKSPVDIFVTLAPITNSIVAEATSVGFIECEGVVRAGCTFWLFIDS